MLQHHDNATHKVVTKSNTIYYTDEATALAWLHNVKNARKKLERYTYIKTKRAKVRKIWENEAYITRAVWLELNGFEEHDVLWDEDGFEYVLSFTENGNPNEDGYGVSYQRIYLKY